MELEEHFQIHVEQDYFAKIILLGPCSNCMLSFDNIVMIYRGLLRLHTSQRVFINP